jgi:hypothetical protein
VGFARLQTAAGRAARLPIRMRGLPVRSVLKTAAAVSVCALAMLRGATPATAAPAPLVLGFNDPFAFQGELGPEQRAIALTRAGEAGGSVVRLGVSWRYVDAVEPPSRADARNHGWSGYRWDDVDSEVRAVLAAGLEPLLVVNIAPDWFEGPSRPSSFQDAPLGTWNPDPEAYGDFAHALADRYGGSARDAAGAPLPRVRLFQAWNEPNLPEFLTPQSRPAARGRVAVSPGRYRRLLDAFYLSAKGVHRDNFVVAAAVGPYGDYPPLSARGRMPPAYFIRSLLCVSQTSARARRCPRVRFDAFAANTFPLKDPRTKPANPRDIRLSLESLKEPLRLAARAGTVSRTQAGRLWVTELGWDAGGPGEISLAAQARYLQMGLYLLWRDGVDTVLWYNLRDRAQPVFTWHSGLFTRGETIEADRPKPSYAAFRFPFVVVRSGRRTLAWGRAPSAGAPVVIEQADGRGGWREVARSAVGSGLVFTRTIPEPGRAQLRARQGDDTSLSSAATTATP